ncbi:MAG TPA: DM13 domain-containing protein [Gammaproteobacteria bacterium]|nr:DM13 domain-containing protein [Gammaproteobacteria bacterium]
MKNVLIGVLFGIILGGVGGFAAGIFVFPYLFPPPPVNEIVLDKEKRKVIARGEFTHANPSDPVHYGRGKVTIYDGLLHLESDFEVGPGPKFHLYLVPEANITPDTLVQETMFVDLGRLKAFSGSQNYAIPAGVNLKEFESVVVWCEQFNVLISPASISFVP